MREGKKVFIVETGTANIASVKSVFQKLGMEPEVSKSPEIVRAADLVVLPGVGSFGAGIKTLRENELDEALKERIEKRSPTLAICLGLQLFASRSEETPDETGLGVISGTVKRFNPGKRVPQFGWNRVTGAAGSRFISDGYAYFANSYCLKEGPENFTSSLSNYSEDFVAAFEDESVLACQFHPELSGQWGLNVVRRWIDCVRQQKGERICSQSE